MNPFFSIIVPVYNVEEYLSRAVQSLLEQTFHDFEIILVDDGSSDRSASICDSLAAQHPHISVLHKNNGGLASARNMGLSVARGRYISFLDSDDWMERNTYEILYQHLQSRQPDILNFGYQKRRNGEILAREHAVFSEGLYDVCQIREKILPDSIACPKAFDQVNLPVQLSACMCVYRREFLENHELLFVSERVVLCEDWLFNISCLCRAESMLILHDIFYNYETRENSISMSYKPDSYDRRKRLYEHYQSELKKTGNCTPEIRPRLENFWMESIYCCYIIECLAPAWSREVHQRMQTLSSDPLFLEYAAKLNVHNCTLKGLAFLMITRLKLHYPFRLLYRRMKERSW